LATAADLDAELEEGGGFAAGVEGGFAAGAEGGFVAGAEGGFVAGVGGGFVAGVEGGLSTFLTTGLGAGTSREGSSEVVLAWTERSSLESATPEPS